ncbi:MAG: hypothetical protein JWR07_3885 [Nevskia sp.]|nr:hypothetical protein [Nevskia sp.]
MFMRKRLEASGGDPSVHGKILSRGLSDFRPQYCDTCFAAIIEQDLTHLKKDFEAKRDLRAFKKLFELWVEGTQILVPKPSALAESVSAEARQFGRQFPVITGRAGLLPPKTRRWDLVQNEWPLLAGSVIHQAATGAIPVVANVRFQEMYFMSSRAMH